MKKYNMIVDVEKCNNCNNCFIATKDEHVDNDFPGYAAPQPLHGHRWLDVKLKERGEYPIVDAHHMPVMCNHCDDAPCMKAAENGAVRKRDDGIVIIDPEKAKGQKQIVDACPYQAVYWNEELEIPQKWIFDAHLLDQGWEKTRAEQACPTGALRTVKVEDVEMQQMANRDRLQTLKPEIGTKPRVYYKNLHLMTQCFVGGTVVKAVDGIEECVAAAKVILKRGDQPVAETETDCFGEFKIDHLEQDSGQYQLEVVGDGGNRTSLSVEMGATQYLGTIQL